MASLFLALIIVATNGPNFFFNSWHRVEFLSSTPWRSLRIRPASRRILKFCDNVDLGTFTLPLGKNAEQFMAQSAWASSAQMRTRTGSDRAYRMPCTVISARDG